MHTLLPFTARVSFRDIYILRRWSRDDEHGHDLYLVRTLPKPTGAEEAQGRAYDSRHG